jgi:hypothetical protein
VNVPLLYKGKNELKYNSVAKDQIIVS